MSLESAPLDKNLDDPLGAPLKSQRVLDEVKQRQRRRSIVDVEEERVKVVIVSCGTGRYAFGGADIREVLPPSPISWVPGLPAYLPGLINVRGDVESVVDLGHFVEERQGAPDDAMVLMAERGDFRTGVLIDAIDDVVDVPVGTIGPPLGTLQGATRELVSGTLSYAGASIPVLDVGKLAALIVV
ncbi:chemotaxis protein CheW [Candidatus Symbiobacter mobilis]|uniref:Chemotaxis protein CheW n=1 Tax=Candidatus Symbiobacter mobilis CR TaxID=946483 RepID=U5NDF1_9BURK|nr:chemotaxis protein CheW [Candidatus Symbiobacter mobilis]AGX88204.1 chemotaxis protein CheW [Candidatus Symbiobacter mobilis CR]